MTTYRVLTRQCRNCMKRVTEKEALTAHRRGGGNYRRGGRVYRSTICITCAASIVNGGAANRWDVEDVRRASKCESTFRPRDKGCELPRGHATPHYARGIGEWIDHDPTAPAWVAPGMRLNA